LAGKLDVKGAFIQMEMSGLPVYIKGRGRLVNVIINTIPELARYVGEDGLLYCKLKKAHYRCVQASKLWYLKLLEFLVHSGYEKSDI
jgi:hypothetical protein